MSDYQSNQNTGSSWSGCSHAMIRAVSIFCLTAFLITAMFMLFSHNGDRFSLVGSDQGLYIFDRKSVDVSYCTADGKCTTTLVKPQELPPMMSDMNMGNMPQPTSMGANTMMNTPQSSPQDVAYCQAVMQNNGNANAFGMGDASNQMNAAQQFMNNQGKNNAQNSLSGYSQTNVIPAAFPMTQNTSMNPNTQPQGDMGGTLLPATPPATRNTSAQAPVNAPAQAAPSTSILGGIGGNNAVQATLANAQPGSGILGGGVAPAGNQQTASSNSVDDLLGL